MASLEGCIVTLDDYILYYHPANEFPDQLTISTQFDNDNDNDKSKNPQQQIAFNVQQESLFLAHYINNHINNDDNNCLKVIDLKFNLPINDNNRWILIIDQEKKSKLKIGVICKLTIEMYYVQYVAKMHFIDKIESMIKKFLKKNTFIF